MRSIQESQGKYRTAKQKTFVAWYNPYSGRAACHVYIYVYHPEKRVWFRKVARVFDGTPQVSVELGNVITIRDVYGKEIHSLPTK